MTSESTTKHSPRALLLCNVWKQEEKWRWLSYGFFFGWWLPAAKVPVGFMRTKCWMVENIFKTPLPTTFLPLQSSRRDFMKMWPWRSTYLKTSLLPPAFVLKHPQHFWFKTWSYKMSQKRFIFLALVSLKCLYISDVVCSVFSAHHLAFRVKRLSVLHQTLIHTVELSKRHNK